MSTDTLAAPRVGYSPTLALRHLWRGPIAPRESMHEALAAGIGEKGRLALFGIFVACLALCDPETRGLVLSAMENVSDDASRLHGLLFLGLGIAVVGLALYLGYWAATLAALLLSGQGWTRETCARMRSVVALSAWFSLLPTLAVKLLALALLPAAMVAADPPSLYSTIEAATVMPYFAACLAAAFGLGVPRAATVAFLINGAFYLVIAILYIASPS